MKTKIFLRIIESKIEELLKLFGCVVIEGPKQVGKTFLGEKFSQSQFYVQEYGESASLFLLNSTPNPIFDGSKPRLIDEWQLVPKIWDLVRFRIDQAKGQRGLYILTGSNTVTFHLTKHSGAGRMAWIAMHTLTFSEIISDDEQPKIALKDLFMQKEVKMVKSQLEINWAIKQLLKGGWPAALSLGLDSTTIIENYIKSLYKIEQTYFDNLHLDHKLVDPILKALAFLNGKQINKTAIEKFVSLPLHRERLLKYLAYFKAMFLFFELNIWDFGFCLTARKKLRVSPKIYLCDPSIGANLLKVKSIDKFWKHKEVLGFYFENQVIKDLMVYAQALNGGLSFYRDDKGFEIDAIMELDLETWAAFEIKLMGTQKQVDLAAKNLLKFTQKVTSKTNRVLPKFLMVIVGASEINYTYCRSDGVYVVPHTCLKPF